jgi:hypothetical protein
MARVGESYYPNQSVNGLVNRMLFIGNNLDWRAHDYPPFHPACTLRPSSPRSLCSARRCSGVGARPIAGGVTDLMILLLSTTMASSIAWEHHYGIMLPMFALVTPALLRLRPCGRWTLGLLVVAYELVSLRLSITNVAAATHWNFLQSYVLAGALLFLCCSTGCASVKPNRRLGFACSVATLKTPEEERGMPGKDHCLFEVTDGVGVV